MATAETSDDAGTAKKKKPILKILLIVLGALVLLGGAVGATLFFSGFFSRNAHSEAEQALAELEEEGAGAHAGKGDGKGHDDGKGGKGAAGAKPKSAPDGPKKKVIPAPEVERYEARYLELDKPLVSNLAGSRKVMQVTVAVMTHYDDRVLKNIERHKLALRSAALDVMRLVTVEDLTKPAFRAELAGTLRDRMNAVLEKHEDFGGIEEVHFTEFIVQ